MNLFVAYDSALEYWRAHPLDPMPPRASRSLTLSECMTGIRDIARLDCARHGIRSRALHVLATSRSSRNSSTQVVCHISVAPVPGRAFVRIADGLYVGSPELTFFHMASVLPFPKLVELGDELCGLYRIDPNAEEGFVKASPVTTPAKLRAFADRMGNARGAAVARKAARYVVGRSASPRETTTVSLLCLPHAIGGYGFELPQMNRRIAVKEHTPTGVVSKELFCDLYWSKHKVAIEYDSDLHHTERPRIAHDSKRRSSLGQEGVYVVTITNEQLKSVRDFDDVARLLAQHLHVRLRIRMADFPVRRLKLRTMLLSDKR